MQGWISGVSNQSTDRSVILDINKSKKWLYEEEANRRRDRKYYRLNINNHDLYYVNSVKTICQPQEQTCNVM